jgi:hypothetical protein
MRPRRFIGVLERRLLGAAMSVVLFVVDRRLNRGSVRAAQDAPRETERRLPSSYGANGP